MEECGGCLSAMIMATTGAAPAQLAPLCATADTLDMVDMAGEGLPYHQPSIIVSLFSFMYST